MADTFTSNGISAGPVLSKFRDQTQPQGFGAPSVFDKPSTATVNSLPTVEQAPPPTPPQQIAPPMGGQAQAPPGGVSPQQVQQYTAQRNQSVLQQKLQAATGSMLDDIVQGKRSTENESRAAAMGQLFKGLASVGAGLVGGPVGAGIGSGLLSRVHDSAIQAKHQRTQDQLAAFTGLKQLSDIAAQVDPDSMKNLANQLREARLQQQADNGTIRAGAYKDYTTGKLANDAEANRIKDDRRKDLVQANLNNNTNRIQIANIRNQPGFQKNSILGQHLYNMDQVSAERERIHEQGQKLLDAYRGKKLNQEFRMKYAALQLQDHHALEQMRRAQDQFNASAQNQFARQNAEGQPLYQGQPNLLNLNFAPMDLSKVLGEDADNPPKPDTPMQATSLHGVPFAPAAKMFQQAIAAGKSFDDVQKQFVTKLQAKGLKPEQIEQVLDGVHGSIQMEPTD